MSNFVQSDAVLAHASLEKQFTNAVVGHLLIRFCISHFFLLTSLGAVLRSKSGATFFHVPRGVVVYEHKSILPLLWSMAAQVNA